MSAGAPPVAFELCDLLACIRDAGKHVAGEQPQRKLVRVAKNDRIVGGQAKR